MDCIVSFENSLEKWLLKYLFLQILLSIDWSFTIWQKLLVWLKYTALGKQCMNIVPLQTKHGNRPSCRDQERRKASDEVVPGTSVYTWLFLTPGPGRAEPVGNPSSPHSRLVGRLGAGWKLPVMMTDSTEKMQINAVESHRIWLYCKGPTYRI